MPQVLPATANWLIGLLFLSESLNKLNDGVLKSPVHNLINNNTASSKLLSQCLLQSNLGLRSKKTSEAKGSLHQQTWHLISEFTLGKPNQIPFTQSQTASALFQAWLTVAVLSEVKHTTWFHNFKQVKSEEDPIKIAKHSLGYSIKESPVLFCFTGSLGTNITKLFLFFFKKTVYPE